MAHPNRTVQKVGFVAQSTEGTTLSSRSSPWFVLNTDAKSTNVDANQGFSPQAVINNSLEGHANVIPARVPGGGLYLELMALWVPEYGSSSSSGDNSVESGQALKVRVFGQNEANSRQSSMPHNLDTTWPTLDAVWSALPEKDNDSTVELELPTTTAIQFDPQEGSVSTSSSGDPAEVTDAWRANVSKYVWLKGSTLVVPIITQPFNNVAKAMLLGRFVT